MTMEQRVRQGAGGLSHYGSISDIFCFGLAWVQVRDAAHRQTRNVTDQDALGLGHGQQHGALTGYGLDDDSYFASSWGSTRSRSFLPFRSIATER